MVSPACLFRNVVLSARLTCLAGCTFGSLQASLNRRLGRESRWLSAASAAFFRPAVYEAATAAFDLLDTGVKAKVGTGERGNERWK